MTKFILLNGPPRSGKDTVGRLIEQQFSSDIHIEKFAKPIKQAVRLCYDIPYNVWRDELDTADNKDLPHSRLLGRTPREVQISFSEDWLKPLHGQNVFGRLLVNRVRCLQPREAIVITDSGFRQEAEELVKYAGPENVFLWRIHREGCNFKGDSRDYISLSDLDVTEVNIVNDLSMNDLRAHVGRLYEACVTARERVPIVESGDDTFRLEDDLAYYARRQTAITKALCDRPRVAA